MEKNKQKHCCRTTIKQTLRADLHLENRTRFYHNGEEIFLGIAHSSFSDNTFFAKINICGPKWYFLPFIGLRKRMLVWVIYGHKNTDVALTQLPFSITLSGFMQLVSRSIILSKSLINYPDFSYCCFSFRAIGYRNQR